MEGRWVKEKNLHLTWVFIGEVDDEQPLIERLQAISPLGDTANITELGYFGRPPKVLFAKAEEKLLYDKAREFKSNGFDLYRFKPHITLCRIKAIHDYKAYKMTLKSYHKKTLGLIQPKIALYQSELTPDGVHYHCKWSI